MSQINFLTTLREDELQVEVTATFYRGRNQTDDPSEITEITAIDLATSTTVELSEDEFEELAEEACRFI